MDRRQFLRTASAAGIAFSTGAGLAAGAGPVPRRSLGRTGVSLPVVGLGGMTLRGQDPARAGRTVARAVEEHGVDYIDVAPTYGNAEELLGPALEPYRSRCFLACKTTQRTAAGAEEELAASLEKLRTDHLDLYQLHALLSAQDVDTAFGAGGAMEVFTRARQDGQVRFLGFSAHSVEAALAAMERFDFDTLLFPVNYVMWFSGFGPQVVEEAQRRGMGVLAIKSLCHGRWPDGAQRIHEPCWYEPVADPEEVRLALAFSLSRGATAVLPPSNEDLYWLAVQACADVQALTADQEGQLRRWAAGHQPLFTYPA